MSTYGKKKDKYHYAVTDIIGVLRDTYGQPISCYDQHMIHKPSVGDIVIGFGGINFSFEIKNSSKDKLTLGEEDFQGSWKGQSNIVHDFKQILFYMNFIVSDSNYHQVLEIIHTLYNDEILPNWKHYGIRLDEDWIKEHM